MYIIDYISLYISSINHLDLLISIEPFIHSLKPIAQVPHAQAQLRGLAFNRPVGNANVGATPRAG